MNTRERFIKTLSFDRPYFHHAFGLMPGVIERWHKEGLAEDVGEEEIRTYFGFDLKGRGVTVNLLFEPPFESEIIEETDEYIIRRESSGQLTQIYHKVSSLPHAIGYPVESPKDWQFKELNYTVHCPVVRSVGDELWLAGKTIAAQFPSSVEIPPEPSPEKITSLTRQDARLAKTPQDWHTAIWRLTGDHLEPILVLPSRGDCGYPGLVVERNRVLMSYYSQHDVDEGPKPKPNETANEIYLAEILQ